MVQRALYAALGFIIIFMVLGFSLLYANINSLRGELEEQSRTLKELKNRVEAQSEALRDIEDLRLRIVRVEDSLKNVASAGDLERVAREVGKLSADIKILESRFRGSNETLSKLIANMSNTIADLSKRVEEFSERLLYPVVIVDGVGDRVIILSKPTRIVSLAPSVTETLYYVGAIDLLVGVDQWSDFPAIVKEKRDRGEIATVDFWAPSVEKVIGLKPDLVIGVASVPSHRALKTQLSAYGIPVLLIPDFRASDVPESLIMVGKALGKLTEAYKSARLVELAFKYAILLSSKVDYKLSVAAIVWVKPLFVVGGNTWESDILEYAGLVNVYGDMKLWPSVSPETLLAKKPETIILTSGHGMVSREDLVNNLVGTLGEQAYDIPAVKNGRIYSLSGTYEDCFVRPSPRTVISLYVLLIVFHPQLFDLKPEDIPYDISPETLDIIIVLKDKVPDEILEFIMFGLKA